MEIGSVNEIARLEHILLPHPSSWWEAETRLIKFENGEKKEKIIACEKISFSWLSKLLSKLEDTLKSEGISTTYLYFSPKPREETDKGTINLYCEPSYLSCFLRDMGIFTKKFFLESKQSKTRKVEYGTIAEKFAEKIQSFGIDVKGVELEGGAFISDGKVGFVSMESDLKTQPILLKECGRLYEFPTLNLHIDNFVNFLNEELFLVNRSCVESIASDVEYMWCDLGCIDKVANILKKKGYRPVEISDYRNGLEYVVGNLLNLGDNKIVMTDPLARVSRRIEREGIDVINLYEKESFHHLRRLRGGLRCLTLPIKRRY